MTFTNQEIVSKKVNSYIFRISKLLIALVALIFIIPRIAVHVAMRQNDAVCQLNNSDLSVLLGAELYFERTMMALSYEYIGRYLLLVTLFLLLASLALDYILSSIKHKKNKLVEHDKTVKQTSGSLNNKSHAIVAYPKALLKYLLLSCLLLILTVVVAHQSIETQKTYANRHLLTTKVLGEEFGRDLTSVNAVSQSLGKCLFNKKTLIIKGESKVE